METSPSEDDTFQVVAVVRKPLLALLYYLGEFFSLFSAL